MKTQEKVCIILLTVILVISVSADTFLKFSIPELFQLQKQDSSEMAKILFQVHATISTLGLAIIAILSGTNNDAIYGISVPRFILQIRPIFLTHIKIIRIIILSVIVNYALLAYDLYNIMVGVFVATILLLIHMIQQNEEKKPMSIKVIMTIFYIRIGLFLLLFLFMILSITINTDNSEWSAFSAGLMTGIGFAQNPNSEQVAYFIGTCFIPLLLLVLCLYLIYRRKLDFFLIALIIHAFLSLDDVFALICDVIILIVVLSNKNSKKYFKKGKQKSILMGEDEGQDDTSIERMH